MTQHHHAPPPDPMPLDPEERALAARLARLGPHGEPSPALDARVLAAAHAATAGGTRGGAARARAQGWRRARWPVGAGVAASVALAAAVAWQMRPLPAPIAPPRETAMRATAPAARVAASAPLRETVSPPPPLPPQEARAADAAVADTGVATEAAPVAAAAPAAAASKALAPPQEPPMVFDAPRAADVAAPPPSPPAPPAPMTAAEMAAAAAATAGPPAPMPQASSASRAAKGAAQTQMQAKAQDALPVFDADDADAPADDVPPATAASPAVRDAWLARIRELAAAGRGDEARASLAEFRRRYPAFAIPEDLRPLLPPAPTAPATHPR